MHVFKLVRDNGRLGVSLWYIKELSVLKQGQVLKQGDTKSFIQHM